MFNLASATVSLVTGANIHTFVNMTTGSERILQIISHFCENQADFARVLGEKTNTVSNWLNRDIGSKVFNKVLKAFPDVNKAWLFTGEGEMLSAPNEPTQPKEQSNNAPIIIEPNKDEIPILDIRVCAGHGIGFDGDENKIISTFYPFRKFQIKKEETRKRCITVGQLRELRDYPVENFQEGYRDIFMLIFYLRGINIGDLCLLRHSDLINGYIEYKRLKTGKQYRVKVEPEAMEIIEKYRGKNYLLNIMDGYNNYTDFRSRINRALKLIGSFKRVGRGGKKEYTPIMDFLSTYWARHTWATMAAYIDIPKETIGAALGHSSNSVTDIYIKIDNRKVDRANRKVIDYVNGTYIPEDDL